MKNYYLLVIFLLTIPLQAKEDAAKKVPAEVPNENSIHVIKPYDLLGTWVFDDADKNLKREPFVAGVPAILNALVADIPNAKKGFRLTFSAIAFPGHKLVATRGIAAEGGYWYHIQGTDKKGWLCPAMFKYFKKAPDKIYVRADAIPDK